MARAGGLRGLPAAAIAVSRIVPGRRNSDIFRPQCGSISACERIRPKSQLGQS